MSNTVSVSFKNHEELLDKVTRLAEETGRTRARMIRQILSKCIDQYMDQYKEEYITNWYKTQSE